MNEQAQTAVTRLDDDVEEEHTDQAAAKSGGETFSSQALRALPRLRELATSAMLLAPVFIASPDFWGGGGVRGC